MALEGTIEATYLLAIDLGKRHFQVCGTDVSRHFSPFGA
jgi:hypothetical protein